jgi:membrane associated rhomboid family serine protease
VTIARRRPATGSCGGRPGHSWRCRETNERNGPWFLYQLVEADFGLFGASANGGGVAFFAHVGGFVFGVLVTWLLTSTGRTAPTVRDRWLPAV